MGLDIAEIQEIHRTVTIKFNGKKLKVVYDLAAINSDLSKVLRNEEANERGSLLTWMEHVLVSWDLTKDGQPIDITADVLDGLKLPSSLLLMINETVNEDATPANLKRSAGTGSRPA